MEKIPNHQVSIPTHKRSVIGENIVSTRTELLLLNC